MKNLVTVNEIVTLYHGSKSKKAGTVYSMEVMYWAGYLYRYWHYYTNEYSREIYIIADAETMNECWLGFHTFDVEMAIDELKEIYNQRRTTGY